MYIKINMMYLPFGNFLALSLDFLALSLGKFPPKPFLGPWIIRILYQLSILLISCENSFEICLGKRTRDFPLKSTALATDYARYDWQEL